MTAITSSGTTPLWRTTVRDLRHWAVAMAVTVAAGLRRLRAEINKVGVAGQLGPNPETQVGRWTGARV